MTSHSISEAFIEETVGLERFLKAQLDAALKGREIDLSLVTLVTNTIMVRAFDAISTIAAQTQADLKDAPLAPRRDGGKGGRTLGDILNDNTVAFPNIESN